MLLDGGGLSPGKGSTASMITALGLSAMKEMGYDAINLGLQEINSPADPGDKSFISTSLVRESSGDRGYVAAPYKLLKSNGMTVAVLGISSAGEDDLSPTIKSLQPDIAIESILPEIKAKADIVILLSDFSVRNTELILQQFDSIDLAIATSGGGRESILKTGNDAYIISSGSGCSELQTAVLELSDNRITHVERGSISLGESVEMAPNILQITGFDKGKTLEEMKKKEIISMQKTAREMAGIDPREMLEKMIAVDNNDEIEARLEKQKNLLKQ